MPSSMAAPSPMPSPLSPAVPLTCPLSSLPASPLAWDLAACWAGEGWGLRGCASITVRCPLRPGSGPGGRWDASGAEQGGGGRWLPAAPLVPGIRRWLRTPRARHSLLARPRDAGKRWGEAPSLFPGKGRRDREPAWPRPSAWGETEAWDGSVRERGAARVSRSCQAGTRLVCRHGAWQGRRVTGVPARAGDIAAAAKAQGQGRNGCPSRACASLIHSPGCPWKCQGVPPGEGQRAACQNRRAPRGSLCWRGGGGAGRGRHWERVPVPPAASQRPHMCAGSALHKGGSEALRSRGLAPA